MKTVLGIAVCAALLAAADDTLSRMSDSRLTVAQRNDACYALRGAKSPETALAMRRALNDPKVRACAGENLRVAGAADALENALGDEDPEVRAIAARELGTLQKPEMLPALAKMARDPQLPVASNALEALESYREPLAREYLLELAAGGGLVGQMALDRLAQLGDTGAVTIARRMLASKDIGNMLAGMRVLGKLGDDSDLSALKTIAVEDTEQISSKGRGFGFMPAISLSRAAKTAIAEIQLRASR
ncbi:MAG: HEAT repeat domain-containing protein [Pseudomonadota bacterium]